MHILREYGIMGDHFLSQFWGSQGIKSNYLTFELLNVQDYCTFCYMGSRGIIFSHQVYGITRDHFGLSNLRTSAPLIIKRDQWGISKIYPHIVGITQGSFYNYWYRGSLRDHFGLQNLRTSEPSDLWTSLLKGDQRGSIRCPHIVGIKQGSFYNYWYRGSPGIIRTIEPSDQ